MGIKELMKIKIEFFFLALKVQNVENFYSERSHIGIAFPLVKEFEIGQYWSFFFFFFSEARLGT